MNRKLMDAAAIVALVVVGALGVLGGCSDGEPFDRPLSTVENSITNPRTPKASTGPGAISQPGGPGGPGGGCPSFNGQTPAGCDPANIRTICNDGTGSCSAGSGTCSGHGGVCRTL